MGAGGERALATARASAGVAMKVRLSALHPLGPGPAWDQSLTLGRQRAASNEGSRPDDDEDE